MNVLVTRATGLVGSFVVRRLLEMGHVPKILFRPTSSTLLITDVLANCLQIEGDILDTMVLEQAMLDCEAVIHCAGIVSFDPRRKKEIFQVNVQGTANVVDACLRSKVRKLIHLSSIAALGRKEQSSVITEKARWEESSTNSFYAQSKYEAELEVYRGGEEGLDFSILNPSIILGQGDPSRSSTRLLAFVKKMPWFYPKGYLNVVDVRDVAQAAVGLLSIDHAKRLIVNAASLSYKEFYTIACEAYSLEAPTSSIPFFLIRLVAFFDKIRRFLIGGEPFVTRENLKSLGKKFEYESLYYDKLFPAKLITPEVSIKHSIKALFGN